MDLLGRRVNQAIVHLCVLWVIRKVWPVMLVSQEIKDFPDLQVVRAYLEWRDCQVVWVLRAILAHRVFLVSLARKESLVLAGLDLKAHQVILVPMAFQVFLVQRVSLAFLDHVAVMDFLD